MTTQTVTKTQKDKSANAEQMFINKVKLKNDGTAEIYYRTTNDNNAQEVYFQGKDEVTDDFKRAFQSTVNGIVAVIPRLEPEKYAISMNAIKF